MTTRTNSYRRQTTHRTARRKHGASWVTGHAADRCLILVDLENYCGKAVLTPEDVSCARRRIEELPRVGWMDLFIIGTSHTNNFVCAKCAWPGAEHVLRMGHNGADVAIIEAARRHLANLGSFREVLMLSGDGIFTSLVREIVGAGMPTTVVSLEGQLNGSLSIAASSVRIDSLAGVAA